MNDATVALNIYDSQLIRARILQEETEALTDPARYT